VACLALVAGCRQADPAGKLASINSNTPNNRLSVAAHDLAAADTIQRTVDLKNIGSAAFTTVILSTTATTGSLLDTDTVNGLQMVIDRCSVAWTEAAGQPYTYSCNGTTSSVLRCGSVMVTNVALANLDLSPDVDNYLLVTLTLPTEAPNPMQNQSSTIQYTFTGNPEANTGDGQIESAPGNCPTAAPTSTAASPVIAAPGFTG
jgi:hypothetical protein